MDRITRIGIEQKKLSDGSLVYNVEIEQSYVNKTSPIDWVITQIGILKFYPYDEGSAWNLARALSQSIKDTTGEDINIESNY